MLRSLRGRMPLPTFVAACLLSAITMVAWGGVMLGEKDSDSVLVQMDLNPQVRNLKVAQAVPIQVRTLTAGQKLPKGAVVVTSPQQLAATHAAKPAKNAGQTAKSGAGKSKVKQQKLMFARTTGSATWPSEKNPLKDFDADFLENYDVKGFPTTTGTANWPFTKNPLLGFDAGFRNKWKGYEGPEYNVYAELPPEYPFLETKLPDSMSHYKAWTNSGGEPENNIYDNPEMWPKY